MLQQASNIAIYMQFQFKAREYNTNFCFQNMGGTLKKMSIYI